jgi:hypothetical protein
MKVGKRLWAAEGPLNGQTFSPTKRVNLLFIRQHPYGGLRGTWPRKELVAEKIISELKAVTGILKGCTGLEQKRKTVVC